MNRSSLHLLSLNALVLTLTLMTPACAQPATLPPLGDRDAARVTATAAFTFYSDFWVNLHDYLYQQAQQEDQADQALACLQGLPPDQQEPWHASLAFYQDQMGHRHHRMDDLMWTVRMKLSGLAPDQARHDSLSIVLDQLQRAAPAYQTCWWADHDRRNRDWTNALVSLLAVHEDSILARLTRLYQDPWPAEAITVDVVSYASWAGANTVIHPDHMMMSSINEGYQGLAGLEMIFHEASHAVIGYRMGTIAEHLWEASRAHDEEPPSDLWHVVLFYTTGKTTQRVLAEAGIEPYTLYMYKRGLFNGRWARFQPPIEQHWQRYLDGEADLRTAAYGVIDALYAP